MLTRSFAVLVALLVSLPTLADPAFSDYFVFGDSLSDTGNVLKVSKLKISERASLLDSYTVKYDDKADYPGPKAPYTTQSDTVNGQLTKNYNQTLGRFTDGKDTDPPTNIIGVWHEQLAPKMGLTPATPSTSGGKNYAFGGAETKLGQTNNTSSRGTGLTKVEPSALLDNIGKQVADYKTSLGGGNAPNTALYIVWGGGNDVINTADAQKKGTATLNDIAAAGVTALNNIKGYIKDLYDKGARKFLWPNLPPIGSIPEYKSDPQALKDKLKATCDQFKTDETAAITQLMTDNAGLSVTQLDILGLFNNVLANPAAFGYDNVDSPVRGTANNPDKWVFWDTIHPTTRTDTLIANAAAQALGVPEPASLSATLIVSLWYRRRRAA